MTYNTYLISQIDDLELREWLIHLDGGSSNLHTSLDYVTTTIVGRNIYVVSCNDVFIRL